jgi:hypothetical protein
VGAVAQILLQRTLRHKLGLAAWENELVERVIRILNGADAELERQIADAIENSRSVDTIRRLRQIRQELAALNRNAYAAAHQHLADDLRSAAIETAAWQLEALDAAVPLTLRLSRPSATLLRSIATARPLRGALLGDHVAKLAGNRLDALVETIDRGLAEQEALSGLMARVRGTRRGRFQDGVLGNVGRRQMEKVVRTAAQIVTETARGMTLAENADILRGVMWVNTLDDRTCRVCQPRDGLVWTVVQHRPVGHDTPWSGGPGAIHWQCRCTQVPVLRSLGRLRRAGLDVDALSDSQRATMEGPVPVATSYADWLRAQPPAVQERALGKARAAAFRDGLDLEAAWRRRFDVRAVAALPLTEAVRRP